MPPERRRREGEAEYEDPSGQSFIKKASKMEFGNPVVDALIRVIVMLAMGGGAGMLTSENKNAEVAHLKEQLSKHEADVEKYRAEADAKWQRYYQRARQDRSSEQANSVCYERRFSRLEGKIQIEPPACVSSAPAAAEAAAPSER
jgi:hypothetical protein